MLVRHLLRLSAFALALLVMVVPLTADESQFQSLFNGKDLSGWDPEPGLWRVKDGVIEGGHPDAGPVAKSSFMPVHRNGEDVVFKDFHFKAEFWIEDSNSGVQYRSRRLHPKFWSVGGVSIRSHRRVRDGLSLSSESFWSALPRGRIND